MQVVYIGPEDEVEVAVGYDTILAVKGEPVEVPDDVANGQPARGDWPGTSGLLAQEGLWAAADEGDPVEVDLPVHLDDGEQLPDFDPVEERTAPAVDEERVAVVTEEAR